MMFPRLAALAETVWSPADSRDYQDFTQRLRVHERRLQLLGVNYRKQTSP
jgi:hexosaminidase